MNVGQTIELEVERMSYGPAAVGRVAGEDGRNIVIFVEGALPGERVSVKLTKNNKNYWEASLVEVLTPSKDRVKPLCPVFDRCGGCQWQHLDYPAQVNAKEEVLLYQLARATKQTQEELKSKLTVHSAKNPYGYRSRLQAHGNRGGIGFYSEGTHSIVHTEQCPVAHPDIQKSWKDFVKTHSLDELAKATGQFKVEWSRAQTGQIKEALNQKHGAYGFTQVNPEQNEVLVTTVTAFAKQASGFLLDLYAGDGNLSNRLLENFERIVCVDTFNDGEEPAAIDSVPKGRTFIKEKVEDFLTKKRLQNWEIEKIDCVIADPPRNGLRETSSRILDLKAPRMILVSCDPSTLARDLTAIIPHYSIEAIHLIDMFPQTYHLETVVSLIRN